MTHPEVLDCQGTPIQVGDRVLRLVMGERARVLEVTSEGRIRLEDDRNGLWHGDGLKVDNPAPVKRPAVIAIEEDSVIVQSPEGRLYGIAFDTDQGREVVNVTELEEESVIVWDLAGEGDR